MSDNSKSHKTYSYKIQSKDKGFYEIEISVSPSYVKEVKEKVFNVLKKGVQIKGFRPGKAPRLSIEAKLGPKLYEETINRLIPEISQKVVDDEKLTILTRPQYEVKKISDVDGLEYVAKFGAIAPFDIPDLKKIKTKKEQIKITEKEIDEVLEDMLKRANKKENAEAKSQKNKKESPKKEQKDKIKIDDEWVKSLKIPTIDSVTKLKDFIKKQLKHRKEGEVEEKYTAELLKELISLADFEIPEIVLDQAVDRREQDYRKRIEQLGLKFEDFLKTKKTTLEELKKEWRKEEEDKAKKEFLFLEIAERNKLKVSNEEVEKELSLIKDEKLKKQYSTEYGKRVIATVLLQQKVISWIKDQISN